MISYYFILRCKISYKKGFWRTVLFNTICFAFISCNSSPVLVTPSGSISPNQNQEDKNPTITTFTSKKRLKEIGADQHEEIVENQPLYSEESVLEYVRKIGTKVAKGSEEPDLGYQFFILDNPGINAFALPGGYIYITRGLLAFMNSEEQLAAVLGHEIAHVAANHHARRGNIDLLGRGATFVGGIATVLATGSGYAASQIADLSSLWAATASAGFGRDLELEADGLSAKYLLDSGYDPQAMFGALTIFKDQEDFARVHLGQSGSYHGSFASHPRTDRRLQEIVGAVGSSDEYKSSPNANKEFREAIDGLIIGESNSALSSDKRNRYYQELLGYTLVFPEDWEIDATTTTVTASNRQLGSLRIEAQRLQENIEPRLFIRDKLGINNLQKSAPLSQYRLEGHTGLFKDRVSGELERIAVIFLGSRAFIFRGDIASRNEEDAIDEMLLSSIQTFRSIQNGEVVAGGELKIKFVQASEYFDFSVVSRASKIKNFPEETLRLINGYYPAGTPKEGEWIKLVE